jgi:hypothetical protein
MICIVFPNSEYRKLPSQTTDKPDDPYILFVEYFEKCTVNCYKLTNAQCTVEKLPLSPRMIIHVVFSNSVQCSTL